MNKTDVNQDIILDFDLYTGNFERDLATFMFGVFEQFEHDPSNKYYDQEIKWAYETESGEGALITINHDEYGAVWQDINVYTKNPELQQEHWSVRFRFSRLLNEKELQEIFEKASKFPEVYKKNAPSYSQHEADKLQFLSLRTITIKTVTETQVWKIA